MNIRRLLAAAVLATALVSTAAAEDSILNLSGGPLALSLVAETGFVGIPYHVITIGSTTDTPANTQFNYVTEGGQEILYPFSRLSAEISINERHQVILLAQPLEVATVTRFAEQRVIDDVVFEAGQVVDVTYSFPFYRASYLYDVAPSQAWDVSLGASLQLRNASIRFRSPTAGNDEIVVSQNLGPVPILKARVAHHFVDSAIPGAFVEMEVDGFYASSAFINGAAYPFTGSIFDASLRTGWAPRPGMEVFVNARLLGGGATGTRGEAADAWTESRDGYTDNFLVTTSLTLGVRLR